jgi:hypothetical protein
MTAKRIFDNTNRRNQKKAFEAMVTLWRREKKKAARSRRREDEFIETVFQHWNMYMDFEKSVKEEELSAKKKGTQEKKKKSFSRWVALVNVHKQRIRKMTKAMAKLTNRREAQRFGYWKGLLLRLKRTRKLMKRINSTLIKNVFMGFKESMHRDKLGARRFL